MAADPRAHAAVRGAILAGRLSAPSTLPCVDCERLGTVYHHHLGYAPEHWLSVVAICDGCHRRRHTRTPSPRAASVTTTLRIPPEHEAVIRRAAAAVNRSLSNFLVTAGLREAAAVSRRQEQKTEDTDGR